ncbi:MAG: hypothetical protein F4092_05080 [Rhodospirillaceae bacterium]|nr:hypothetical protein [Rhodospirillaceae bacterium]MYJ71139.1 hypothetical protein [Rhodospirillaceae bacterium]
MGYLIGEIWLWLVIAYVIGLVAGWLIWGLRRKGAQNRIGDLERQVAEAAAQALESEAEKSELAAAAAAAEAEITRLNARIAELVKERRSAGDGRD